MKQTRIIMKAVVKLICTLALVLLFLPQLKLTSKAFEEFYLTSPYGLWVGNVPVTESTKSGNGWSYNPSTNTLTLNGFSYEGTGSLSNFALFYDKESAAIFYNARNSTDLKLVLNGTNEIVITNSDSSINTNGLLIEFGGLAISGTGKLFIATMSGKNPTGIYVGKSCTISGGELVVYSNRYGIACKEDVTITGSDANVSISALESDSVGIHSVSNDTERLFTIGSDIDSVFISGAKFATDFKVKTAVNLGAWKDNDGEYEEKIVTASESGQDFKLYKCLCNEYTHIHKFENPVVSGSTYSAVCTNPFCYLTGSRVPLTICAPEKKKFGDAKSEKATLKELKTFIDETGDNTLSEDNITYYKGKTRLSAAPKDAGTYIAKLSKYNISVTYTIAPAETKIKNVPKASEITYGQKLSESELTNGSAFVDGTFTWSKPDIIPSVADSQSTEYDVTFTPSNTNYGPLTCKVKLTVNKAAATIEKDPTAKRGLKKKRYWQELVNNDGVAGGGQFLYALGTDDENAPKSGYSENIPNGFEAKAYYVWYKVAGDANHTDSEADCVKVTISPVDDVKDNIETQVVTKDNTPAIEVSGLNKELGESVLTDVEKARLNAGDEMNLYMEMTNIDASVSQTERTMIQNKAREAYPGAVVGMIFDMSLYKQIGKDSAVTVTNTGNKALNFKLSVPSAFLPSSGVKRNFCIIKLHNNSASMVANTTSTVIPFSTNEFSTYAIVYADKQPSSNLMAGIKVTQKNSKLSISWEKSENAAKYEVFAAYCNKKYPSKPVKTTAGNKVTLKKLNGKNIDFSREFKIYVVEYDSTGKEIGKTVEAHVAGKDNKKYTNAKAVKVAAKAVSISRGATSGISAKITLSDKKKKQLPGSHAPKFRYESDDPSIANVDKSGNVTGISTGTCTIYVHAKNGLSAKVAVTVN